MMTTEYTLADKVAAWEAEWFAAYAICLADDTACLDEPDNPYCLAQCADYLTSN
jgi:hypothetical protein